MRRIAVPGRLYAALLLAFSGAQYLTACTEGPPSDSDVDNAHVAEQVAGPGLIRPSGRWTLVTIGNAPTPPMGWNSWNAFRTGVDEEKVLGSAHAIVDSGLAALGYQYINIDDGWWLRRRESDGRLVVRTSIFPSAKSTTQDPSDTSFRPFVERIHALGLKAGIYSDIGRNACSQAWDPESPNLPEGNQNEKEIGTYNHVDQDITLYFEEWGFDYIKVDACGVSDFGSNKNVAAEYGYRFFEPLIRRGNVNMTDIAAVQRLYGQIRDALIRSNPDNEFVFSICNWGQANVRHWGKDYGNLWRTSGDIVPFWTRMLHTFDTVSTRALYAGPGTWNDPDMLFIGHGEFDENHITEAESHFALWSIVAAPLLIGYDLRNAPKALLDIWSAEEIIAVNQDPAGHQGVMAYSGDDVQIFVKTLQNHGEKAVVLLNRGLHAVSVQLTAEHLKFDPESEIKARDLRLQKNIPNFTGEASFYLEPRETVILKVVGEPLLGTGMFLSEIPGRINVAEDGVHTPEEDPTVHRMIDPWGSRGSGTRGSGERPEYTGWGGPRADSTPYDDAIQIHDRAYRYGIGTLARSHLEVKLDMEFSTFTAEVGVDDSTRSTTSSVRFEVYGDGVMLASSGALRFGDGAERMSADVVGVDVLELIVQQLSGDNVHVVVAWANAALD